MVVKRIEIGWIDVNNIERCLRIRLAYKLKHSRGQLACDAMPFSATRCRSSQEQIEASPEKREKRGASPR